MLFFDKNNNLRKITNIVNYNGCENINQTPYEKFLMGVYNKPRPFNDSFNILNKYQTIDYCDLSETLSPAWCHNSIPDSFSELVDRRICEIFNNRNKKITILYSGGCDSGTVMAGLLRNRIDKESYDVLCSDTAVNESPVFYSFLRKEGVNIVNVGRESIFKVLNEHHNDGGYINGCPEQIFSYPVTCTNFKDFYFCEWKDGVRKIIEKNKINLNEKEIDFLIDILTEYILTLNLPITKTVDLMWLIVFSGMWNYAPLMFKSDLNLDATYNSHCIPFFKTEYFAQWALTNSLFHNRIDDWSNGNIMNYRKPEKEYIRTVFNNEEILFKAKTYSQTKEYEKGRNGDITVYHEGNQAIRFPHEYKEIVFKLINKEENESVNYQSLQPSM